MTAADTPSPRMQRCVDMLHSLRCSCVIDNGTSTPATFHDRGVRDLYRTLRDNPALLHGSVVADKVVGKGAAALMALGKVDAVYADVISLPALTLLRNAGIDVSYGAKVPNIINRAGTGICPVESLCASAATPGECLPLIENFINNHNNR